ncbi:MAG: ribbon-helix-helix protein, CopG family [Gemmatimonadota bacterium]|nr:ribbon-helix-helix protein, CopG family [Gemmatimonadota bacterium]
MATPRIKATYSLDADTVRRLEKLAEIWDTSKSEALRRAIRSCDVQSDALLTEDDARGKQDAFRALQKSMNISKEAAEEWARQVREERHGWPSLRRR